MPTDNLFAEDFVVDPNKNYLEELVGEEKKFKSPEDLARGKAEADAFIAKLQNEQLQLRNELDTRIKYEEFLDQVRTALPTHSNEDNQDHEQRKDQSAITPEELERLLELKLNQKDAERTAVQNLASVKNRLQEALGPNYAQHLKRQTQELGMTEVQVQNLATTNPNILYRLLGIDGSKQAMDTFSAPPKTQVTGFPQGSSKGKGDSYYEQIRKEKPREYWSPKIQNEIFERIKEVGSEAFYST